MIKPIMRDPIFLAQKSEDATEADKQVVQDPNSMKLRRARGATQDGRVMVERSDRMWSTGEENGKPLQYSCLEKTP